MSEIPKDLAVDKVFLDDFRVALQVLRLAHLLDSVSDFKGSI
jgi:hypothetical protein